MELYPGLLDLSQNLCSRRSPLIPSGMAVAFGQVSFDGAYQLGDTGEAALPDGLLGQIGKEAFHQIQPRTAGGSKVQMEAGMAAQPVAYPGVFVSGVVVHDQVEIQS